ncbi:MAG: VTT domain-containing protein [Nanoarchaeota archaeon]
MIKKTFEWGKKATSIIHFYTFGKLKRLYEWVMSWAQSKYATLALAILAFMESSFFPIPPDPLQITLSLSKPKRSFWYAFVASLFSVLGGIFGYFLGWLFFDTIGSWIINSLGYQAQFAAVGELFKANAFLAILTAAFTPIPYKIFTLAAGFWQVGWMNLILASIIGRSGRFFFEAVLIYFFGEKIKVFIEKYFNLLTFVVLGIIILGFVAVKYLM